jgi:O-methyltransferase
VSLYLDLLERILTNTIYEDPPTDRMKFDADRRRVGRDWPSQALTMIGCLRLHHLREICETVLRENVPGDLIETGVWRGGACILMRGVLAAHGVTDRKVWVADSFCGLPPPDPKNVPDEGDLHHTKRELAVGIDEVRRNFERVGLLDSQVEFLKGWFEDTLPVAPIEKLAILRLDGDMYGSTMVALRSLYSKLSPGGFCIVDDYALPGCRTAVTEFRESEGITTPLINIDGMGSYWRRERS